MFLMLRLVSVKSERNAVPLCGQTENCTPDILRKNILGKIEASCRDKRGTLTLQTCIKETRFQCACFQMQKLLDDTPPMSKPINSTFLSFRLEMY